MTRRKRQRKTPFQNLYEDGISYSTLSKFVNCRERFRLYYIEGLSPEGTTDALEFGNMFHLLIEHHAKGRTLQELESLLFNNLPLDEDIHQLAREVFVTFKHYIRYWGESDQGKVYVSQEEKFLEEVILPSKRKLKLKGRFDGIYRDNGGLWLQENKTKSQIQEEVLAHILPFDLQTMMYCYCIYLKYKEVPAGVLYNVIRRQGLRRGSKESLQDYTNRIDKDIADRPSHYFIRYTIEITKTDIDNFCRQTLFPLLESVCVWWESIQHDPFHPWLTEDGDINVHHWQRPFGVYDSFKNGKGDYFDLLTKGTDVGLRIVSDDDIRIQV